MSAQDLEFEVPLFLNPSSSSGSATGLNEILGLYAVPVTGTAVKSTVIRRYIVNLFNVVLGYVQLYGGPTDISPLVVWANSYCVQNYTCVLDDTYENVIRAAFTKYKCPIW